MRHFLVSQSQFLVAPLSRSNVKSASSSHTSVDDGCNDGLGDGYVGLADGCDVGLNEGDLDGDPLATVGKEDGKALGSDDGIFDGNNAVGLAVGFDEG